MPTPRRLHCQLLLAAAIFPACDDKSGAAPTDSGASETDADTDTDTDSDTDTDTPADNIGTVLGNCGGERDEPDEYPNQLISGRELQRYTLQDPDALCNDGTPAVMYVRGHTDEALADVWSIHLQGGGACNHWEDCAIRWCGNGYYDASKMSSAWAPLEIGAVGIYDNEPENLLAGANQIYFYYCSSDGWTGRGSWSLAPEGEEGEPYTVFARGHTILSAAIDELETGIIADDGEALPPLSDATHVLLSGTSGGSIGAQAHADWLSERLAGSGTTVLAVFDAANNPWTEYLPAELQSQVEPLYRDNWALKLEQADHTPFADESCWSVFGGTEEEYRCAMAHYVLANHITTPFFVRQDLRDLTDIGEASGISEHDHELAVRDTLLALADLPSTAAEGAAMTRAPGAYGPNCAQHVALETNDWWRVATVDGPDGEPYTFQRAVLAWYQGETVQVVDEAVEADGEAGPLSNCVGLDDEH